MSNMIGDLWDGLTAAFSNRKVRLLVSLTATVIGGASVFYHFAEGWGPLDSVFFSVITISTVGYGDFSPQTAAGKLFTIFYVISGLGLFVATATAIANSIIDKSSDTPEDDAD